MGLTHDNALPKIKHSAIPPNGPMGSEKLCVNLSAVRASGNEGWWDNSRSVGSNSGCERGTIFNDAWVTPVGGGSAPRYL